jgi:hypothetical protein
MNGGWTIVVVLFNLGGPRRGKLAGSLLTPQTSANAAATIAIAYLGVNTYKCFAGVEDGIRIDEAKGTNWTTWLLMYDRGWVKDFYVMHSSRYQNEI